jgi:hypothetical protein
MMRAERLEEEMAVVPSCYYALLLERFKLVLY